MPSLLEIAIEREREREQPHIFFKKNPLFVIEILIAIQHSAWNPRVLDHHRSNIFHLTLVLYFRCSMQLRNTSIHSSFLWIMSHFSAVGVLTLHALTHFTVS
jgi:hypothetical protein